MPWVDIGGELLWQTVSNPNRIESDLIKCFAEILFHTNADRLDLDGEIYEPRTALVIGCDLTRDEYNVITFNVRLVRNRSLDHRSTWRLRLYGSSVMSPILKG